MSNKPSTKAALEKRSRKLVESPHTGECYGIRKLSPLEFIAFAGVVPGATLDEKMKASENLQEIMVSLPPAKCRDIQHAIENLVMKAVMEPQLDNPGDFPGQDLIWLFGQINVFSGVTEENKEAVRPS